MSLNLSWLWSPRTFFAAIFGTDPNTPFRLGQPWNKNILNTIWLIQLLYALIMIGSGIAGMIALKTSPMSNALKGDFKLFFYAVSVWTFWTLIFTFVQKSAPRVYNNNYAKVRGAMFDMAKIQFGSWSLLSPIIWWSSKWNTYDRLILNWTSFMYNFAFFVYAVPSLFILVGYWKDLEAGRPSQEQERGEGEGEALIDQSTGASQ